MKKIVLLALIFSLSTTTFLTAQSKPSQKETFATTYHNSKTLVKTQKFQFVGEMVYNSEKREKLNNESNSLTIIKSEILGEVISVGPAKKTINLNGKIENYNVSFEDDKQQISIAFNVNTASETVMVSIEVKPNGNAFLTASSSNTTTIYWSGKLKNIK